ncbi:hypothetical protein FQR65_LT13642 [Abscondita terminalis]|nr:hypothetical protein FQR65_LT13642 [Abscondita terminalis]
MSYNKNNRQNSNWLFAAGVIGAVAAGVSYFLSKNSELPQFPPRECNDSKCEDFDPECEQCNEDKGEEMNSSCETSLNK